MDIIDRITKLEKPKSSSKPRVLKTDLGLKHNKSSITQTPGLILKSTLNFCIFST